MNSDELEVEPDTKECEIIPCAFCTLHFTNKMDLNIHCITPFFTEKCDSKIDVIAP